MSDYANRILNSQRLRQMSAKTRLDAVRSELALLTSLCVAVDSELSQGHREEARRIIKEGRRALNRIRGSVTHLSEGDTATVRQQLARLEVRIRRIEDRSQ